MRSLDRRLLRSSRAARAHLLVAVALGLISAAAVVAQAVLLARVVDGVFLEGAGVAGVQGDLVAFVAVALVRALASWGFETSGALAAARAMSELRARLLDRVLQSSPLDLRREQSGEVAAAAVHGVDGLEVYFARYLPQVALAALVPVAVLVWVVQVDLVAAAILAVTVPLIPLFMVLIGRAAERRAASRFQALSLLGGRFLDTVRGLPTLRAFGRAEAQAEKLAEAGDRYRRETMRTLRVAFLSALVLELAAMLGTAMVAVVLGVRLADGGMAFQDALTVLLLAPELYLPLRQLGAQYHASADGLAAARRVFELAEAPVVVAAAGRKPVPAGAIRFEAVSYEYASRPGLALDGVDLELYPGECVALVGPNGAGKSTVVSLLLRFADPTSGRVTVGGVDLRELDLDSWRARVAWVPQRPHLFSATVAENIRLGHPDASDTHVRAAVEAVGVDFVDLDTRIGEGGRRLSAGESRRVAVARAFLRDAPLVILDEPTAHLDGESARRVADAVARLAEGRTTLLVAHEEAVVARADRVIVLEAGRVAAAALRAAA